MKKHRFAIQDGDSFSKPIRRQGDGPVRMEILVLHLLRSGTLHVALQGSPEGTDWSEIASWQGTSPGYNCTGDIATRFPWLRARLWLDKARMVIAELFLIEAAYPAGDSPSERKEGKS